MTDIIMEILAALIISLSIFWATDRILEKLDEFEYTEVDDDENNEDRDER